MSGYAFHWRISCGTSWIRERVPVPRYRVETGPRLSEWSDEDLNRIRSVLKKLTCLRVDNRDDAEDLVQETLLTMTEKCSRTRLEKGLLVWGMGILRRKIGNYYRRGRRFVSLDEICGSAGDNDQHFLVEPAQESARHYAELRALVDKALASLAPRERLAVELFLAGSPTREIVDLLYPERYQNIVNWIHRGRRKVARELAKYGYHGIA